MSPSIWQILLVLAIVILLFGPKRIPGLGKSLGEAIRGFKKGLNEDNEIDITHSSNKEQIHEGSQPEKDRTAAEVKDKEERPSS